ncbi:hypothetical protein LTR50_003538 [Elasticomyces elasticus]|nr:hypothetical protein LTR50_003538 [Elasticomyces elasticus]
MVSPEAAATPYVPTYRRNLQQQQSSSESESASNSESYSESDDDAIAEQENVRASHADAVTATSEDIKIESAPQSSAPASHKSDHESAQDKEGCAKAATAEPGFGPSLKYASSNLSWERVGVSTQGLLPQDMIVDVELVPAPGMIDETDYATIVFFPDVEVDDNDSVSTEQDEVVGIVVVEVGADPLARDEDVEAVDITGTDNTVEPVQTTDNASTDDLSKGPDILAIVDELPGEGVPGIIAPTTELATFGDVVVDVGTRGVQATEDEPHDEPSEYTAEPANAEPLAEAFDLDSAFSNNEVHSSKLDADERLTQDLREEDRAGSHSWAGSDRTASFSTTDSLDTEMHEEEPSPRGTPDSAILTQPEAPDVVMKLGENEDFGDVKHVIKSTEVCADTTGMSRSRKPRAVPESQDSVDENAGRDTVPPEEGHYQQEFADPTPTDQLVSEIVAAVVADPPESTPAHEDIMSEGVGTLPGATGKDHELVDQTDRPNASPEPITTERTSTMPAFVSENSMVDSSPVVEQTSIVAEVPVVEDTPMVVRTSITSELLTVSRPANTGVAFDVPRTEQAGVAVAPTISTLSPLSAEVAPLLDANPEPSRTVQRKERPTEDSAPPSATQPDRTSMVDEGSTSGKVTNHEQPTQEFAAEPEISEPPSPNSVKVRQRRSTVSSRSSKDSHRADHWERPAHRSREANRPAFVSIASDSGRDVKPPKRDQKKGESPRSPRKHSKLTEDDREWRRRRNAKLTEEDSERHRRREVRRAEEVRKFREEQERIAEEQEARKSRREARREGRRAAKVEAERLLPAQEATKTIDEEKEPRRRHKGHGNHRDRGERRINRRSSSASRPLLKKAITLQGESVTKAGFLVRTNSPLERPTSATPASSRHEEGKHTSYPWADEVSANDAPVEDNPKDDTLPSSQAERPRSRRTGSERSKHGRKKGEREHRRFRQPREKHEPSRSLLGTLKSIFTS